MKKKKKLTIKEKKLVKGVVQGKTQAEAYREAGYAMAKTDNANKVNAHKAVQRPHIQQAIEEALIKQGATPEWAVHQLMRVADQDEEMGAKRLASMNILELHGWNKAERPTMTLQVKNAFFQGARNNNHQEPIDVE